MNRLKFLAVALVVFFGQSLYAQTVDEIIDKYVEALGGKEKLSQVKSLYTENSMEVMGNVAPQREYLVEGKAFKTEVEFNGSNIISCFTDKNGWSINPMMGVTTAEAMPDDLYLSGKSQIYMCGGLVGYAEKGLKAELAGKEETFFKIKLTDGTNETFYFIDTSSYLLSKSVFKSEIMGQAVDVITTYADYKKTDFGVQLPFSKNIDMGMFQLSQKINKAEFNKEFDMTIFSMPK
jgi:hypothetical protein